ncbi:IgGFc-binding protein [Comamonas serinivorans]|nr:IgGFc-binding protein [Comamonas serinivorans]
MPSLLKRFTLVLNRPAWVLSAAMACAAPAWADFIAVGHPNYTSAAVGHLFIFGASGATGTVTSKDGVFNQTFTVDASGVAEVTVPSSQFLDPSNTVLGKALLVQSASPISGYFLNREIYTTDMSYLLDLPALGTEYRVMGWENSVAGSLQMSLTATQDGTTATITPANDLSSGQLAGVPFTVSLNAGESVIYNAPTGNDLTGSRITANKPLAVFSGSGCANVPVGVFACDHLFTQLPPVNRWSRNYVVPETANTGAAGNLVRILAATNGTQVTVNGTVVATLNAGEFHQIDTAHDLHITANNPVLVGQFLKGVGATGFGDPAFTFIGGMDQTLSSYAFTAPTSLSPYDENFLNLAVPTTALASLQLNGVAVDTSAFTPVGTSGYSAGRVAIATGPGRIQASAPFLATIAGFTSADSYLTIIGTSYSSGASNPDPVAPMPVPVGGVLPGLAMALGVLGVAGWRRRQAQA